MSPPRLSSNGTKVRGYRFAEGEAVDSAPGEVADIGLTMMVVPGAVPGGCGGPVPAADHGRALRGSLPNAG